MKNIMKSKWAAVITLFILSVISCFYLYKNTIRDLNEYYKDGICCKSPLEDIRKKSDGKEEKSLYMQKFIEKYNTDY